MIVLINLSYFVSTVYEQWQEYKRDKARQKQVEEYGVLPLIKLVEQRFNFVPRKTITEENSKEKECIVFRVRTCRTCGKCVNSRDTYRYRCHCRGRSLGQKRHLNLRTRCRVLFRSHSKVCIFRHRSKSNKDSEYISLVRSSSDNSSVHLSINNKSNLENNSIYSV